jgi:hypothetical protein
MSLAQVFIREHGWRHALPKRLDNLNASARAVCCEHVQHQRVYKCMHAAHSTVGWVEIRLRHTGDTWMSLTIAQADDSQH